MKDMNRNTNDPDEATLAARLEAEAGNVDMWEDDPAPADLTPRGALGTQISLRLNPAQANAVRQIAKTRHVGYTSLLRTWIADRIRSELHRYTPGQTENNYGAAFTLAQVHNTFEVGDRLRPTTPLTRIQEQSAV